MADKRLAKPDDVVVYHDPKGVPHNALVTVAWSASCINVVFVSGDADKQDTYGRQIERQTSLNHVSDSTVHGQYWRWPDEKPNPYVEPEAK